MGDLSFLPKPFDLIFMGPPYVDLEKKALALVEPTFRNIMKHDLLAKNGIVVAQHHIKEVPASIPPGMAMVRQERYGDTRLSFFKQDVGGN